MKGLSKIKPARVRYIKLGHKGGWEKECEEEGIIRFGFGSATPERFPLCTERKWDELFQSFISAGKDKGAATRATNETKFFMEDDGSTLWITFIWERLCWGFLKPTPAKQHDDGDGTYRVVKDGWRSKDILGGLLTKDQLSGALTKLAAYRGTSCTVDVAEYVIKRINGEKSPQVEKAVAAMKQMKESVLDLMRMLGWKDFETLVDLVFSTSGWRRQGVIGKTQKTLDLDLMLPSTEERAFVQVKSKTTSAELAEYVAQLDERGPYDKMFYVYHSGEASTEDDRVVVLGPEAIAGLVLDAGLANWLIRKVS